MTATTVFMKVIKQGDVNPAVRAALLAIDCAVTDIVLRSGDNSNINFE